MINLIFIKKAIEQWYQLNEREQKALLLGLLAVLLYLFYALLYQPLINAMHHKKSLLLEKQQTLVWAIQVQQQFKQKKPQHTLNHATLLTAIANQLNTGPLSHFPYQLQQTLTGDIQLSYNVVPFNPFLIWLWRLNQDYNLALKQFDAEKTNTSGLVKLQLVIGSG